MTCLEKLRTDHPGMGEESARFIIDNKCPHDYGYLPESAWCRISDNEDDCEQCWNREIPGTEKSMVENAKADMEKDMDEVVEEIVKPRILDSGNRRQFESGAVRDIQEGKGRCDLLPLDVVGDILHNAVFNFIDSFQKTGDSSFLMNALLSCGIFSEHEDSNSCYLHNMLLEVAIHFEEGAKKYGDNNWRKGIPVRCYIDSGVRHYLKFLRGDKDEPHDRAFCWNIMCAIWTCKHKPELNEYGKSVSDEKGVSKRMPYDYVKEES